MKNKSSQAFTLIEIIVVLIILGILASLAIPAYFNWIRRSQAAEAFVSLGSIKSQLVPCLRANIGDITKCFSPSAQCSSTIIIIQPDGSQVSGPINNCFDVVNPGSPNFSYKATNMGLVSLGEDEMMFELTPESWGVQAFRGVETDGNSITISSIYDANQTVCYASGEFKGIC